jgi:hypothetical protein
VPYENIPALHPRRWEGHGPKRAPGRRLIDGDQVDSVGLHPTDTRTADLIAVQVIAISLATKLVLPVFA